jgi:nucleotide-binding universal stress UspA family protein
MQTLICFREFPYAEPTVSFGGLVAGLISSSTTLLRVIANEDGTKQAKESLVEAQRLLQGLEVTTKIRIGNPLKEIFEEASEGEYDIVVVGSHEVLRLLDSLFDTFTDKIANKATSNVLVVRGEKTELNQILIPIGGQKMSRPVVELGSKIANAAGAEVTLLYVTSPIPTMYTGMEGMEDTLPILLESDTPISHHLHWAAQYLDEHGVKAELKLQQGVASDEIMREAHVGDYDLIVIGARTDLGPFRKILIDQVTPHVIERSPCPVLVVH